METLDPVKPPAVCQNLTLTDNVCSTESYEGVELSAILTSNLNTLKTGKANIYGSPKGFIIIIITDQICIIIEV